jgi:hypothetical protein
LSQSVATAAAPAVVTNRSRQRRLIWLVLLLLLLAWLGYKTWRVLTLLRSLQARQPEIQALVGGGLTNMDPDRTEAAVLATTEDVGELAGHLRPFAFVAPLFGWLPKVGPLLSAAPHFVEMADAGSEAGAYAIQGLKPALVVLQAPNAEGASRLPGLIAVLDEAGPELAQAAAAMDRVVAARAEIGDPAELPWRVQTLLAETDPLLAFAHDALYLAPVLPEIMGQEGLRTYLIIAQNEDELRPTGGYISGAGLLIVDQGAIVNLSFEDANVIDDYHNKPYGFPPQPLYDFMGSELFLFRDANFWPDFPTSAESVMNLYTYGQGPALDGVIATDQAFLQMLLSAVGPLQVSELDQTLTSDNVINLLRSAWSIQEGQTANDWFESRKAFMGPMAAAIRNHLENNPGSIDVRAMARVLHTAVATKHLQIYMRDPDVAAVLYQLGWDGRLPNLAGQDTLMVVETSMGFNKSRPLVESSLAYHVTLAEEGGGQAQLDLSYEHQGQNSGLDCDQSSPYTGGLQYESLINECYWNYLRVYAPAGSQLIEASHHPAPPNWFISGRAWDGQATTVSDDPSGLAVFTNFIVLPRASTLDASFTYRLPAAIIQAQSGGQQRYQLTVYKQAGLGPQPFELTVTLPPGTGLVSADPVPTLRDGQNVTFITTLDSNLDFVLIYR